MRRAIDLRLWQEVDKGVEQLFKDGRVLKSPLKRDMGWNVASSYGFESEREERESSKNCRFTLHRASTADGLCRLRPIPFTVKMTVSVWGWSGSLQPLSETTLICGLWSWRIMLYRQENMKMEILGVSNTGTELFHHHRSSKTEKKRSFMGKL